MTDYDLGALSPPEFELLIRDLLQEEWLVPLESFKSGKDRGIDIRYIENGTTIIQCKHFFESTYSNLKSKLKFKEREKVEKLDPDRYVLVTSVELSPDRKKELKEIFNPFCKKESDIIGREDIQNLLNRHEKIVKRHPKLWFFGTLVLQEVLDKIVNNEIYVKTEMDIEEFQNSIPKIVITQSFKDFNEILDEHNVCIICGNPGSGKTTMMKFFVLNYVNQGYQPIKISDNINEAFKVPQTGDKRIYYYDDFLGQTFFEKSLGKNEDSEILLFIKSIKKQKNKKFILSTREYVLKQAETIFERIKEIECEKFIINCSEFSIEEKAKILYNHLWHSQINPKNIENLINERNYLKIILHRNFNPRLIETMTKVNNINCENFIEKFILSLDNPEDVWKEVFEHKISTNAQTILLIMSTFKSDIEFEELHKAYLNFYSNTSDFWDPKFSKSFKEALYELHDTFIKSKSISESKVIFDFHNPSIRDFIQNYLLGNKLLMNTCCEKSISYSQIVQMWNILQYGCRKKFDSHFLNDHIDIFVYLKQAENFFDKYNVNSYHNFEEMLYHLVRVTKIIKDPRYLKSLNEKLKLSIKRNYDSKTTNFDALYTVIRMLKDSNEFTSIETLTNIEELIRSTKYALLSSSPTYISDFKLIQKFHTDLGIEFECSEMDIFKNRLKLVLDEGILIDDDLEIFTSIPDSCRIENVGSGIEGLEELENDLVEISLFFEDCVNIALEFVRKKINEYYNSLDPPDDDEDKRIDFEDMSNLQSENEIDSMFESLRDK
jgi:hypothetical protein